MIENELEDVLFDLLIENSVDLATSNPISAIRICLKIANWLSPNDTLHVEAAEKAVLRYKKSGFYSDFKSDFRSDFRK